MKLYLLIASALLWGCASSQPSTKADPHAGHNHAKEVTSEDSHEGHDHAAGDSHEGHDHAEGDSHEGHDHAEGDSHEGHDHAAEKPSNSADGHAEGVPNEIVFSPAQAAAIGLTTETVTPSKFESVIRCAGQINGAQGGVYTVTATADGIVSLPASTLSLGKRVTKGETLATVSARTMVGGDQNAKNELAYQTARKEYERAQKLVADNKIISDKEFEQIALNYETQKMAWQSSSKGDTPSGVKVAAANGGYITELLVANGQYVAAGTPIATVSETQNLELRVDVPAKHASRLGEVRSANFLSSNAGQLYRLDDMSGRVLSYARTATNGSAYLPLTFSFANRAGVVSGSFVEVFLMLRTPNEAISVPIASVIEEQGSHSVMVQLDAECYEKRLVQVGMNNGERVEVLRGLKSGDKVVAKGAYQVKMAANSSAIPDGHNH